MASSPQYLAGPMILATCAAGHVRGICCERHATIRPTDKTGLVCAVIPIPVAHLGKVRSATEI